MTTDDPASRGFSLNRWSRRKLEAARAASATAAEAPSAGNATTPAEAAPSPLPSTTAGETTAEVAAPALPPVESLTIDSDFSAFLGPRVDPAIKLQALKKLFRDPRFNVMDGLDVYIDDYSIPDPLAPEVARTLAHARYVFDPPRTRVNEAGIVEDIPADEASIEARESPPEATTQAEATSLPDPMSSSNAAPSPTTPNVQSECAVDSTAGESKPSEAVKPARR